MKYLRVKYLRAEHFREDGKQQGGESAHCRVRGKGRESTYNVDDQEHRIKNDYITATHNANKMICRQTATLCVKAALPRRNSSRFRCHIHYASGMVN